MQAHELDEFVAKNLPDELREVSTGGFVSAGVKYGLRPAEKALLYHYTCEGYRELNRLLHASNGTYTSPIREGLEGALRKLPFYRLDATSAVYLSPAQLATYQADAQVSWPAFLSASTEPRFPKKYVASGGPAGEKNCLLLIDSSKGRAIEEFSLFGPNGARAAENENEILFCPNAQFSVKEAPQLRQMMTVKGLIPYTEISLQEL